MAETAWLSKKLGSDKILCQACAQACKLDPYIPSKLMKMKIVYIMLILLKGFGTKYL